jgi:hypothetical protein
VQLPDLLQNKDRRLSKGINFSTDFASSFNTKFNFMTPVISKATILSGVSSPLLHGDMSPVKADIIKTKLNNIVNNQKTPTKVSYYLFSNY